MILLQQYELIKSTRTVLFKYLDAIPFEQLTRQIPAYNNASVCYLLKHVADVYCFWIKHIALQKEVSFNTVETFDNMHKIRAYYMVADECIKDFVNTYADINTVITGEIKSRNTTVNVDALTLFTHMVTHEFHHKGQILNMTRQLGYMPVDTDVVRF